MRGAPIGVFDSGMGGLSVLRALRSEMPYESFIYYGDNANAPYGPRPREEIEDLALKVARELCARGAKALVVACNTATAAALEALRAGLDVPVIGMAPDLEGARVRGGRAGDRLCHAGDAVASALSGHALAPLPGRGLHPRAGACDDGRARRAVRAGA